MKYESFVAFLNGRDSKRTGEVATTIERSGFVPCKWVYVRYHDTYVVSCDGNTYELRTGGWHSMTTKKRINKYSPARLFQRKGTWYLSTSKGDVEFYDGIKVDEHGDVVE